MRFVQFIIMAISATTLALAYTVPEGAADGVYMAYINSDDQEVHISADDYEAFVIYEQSQVKKLANSKKRNQRRHNEPNTSPNKQMIHKRDSDDYYCECGTTMNGGETDRALEGLAAILDRATTALCDRTWYSIDGSVVAFLCTGFEGSCTVVTRDDTNHYFPIITGRCGRYVPGTLQYWRDDGGWGEGGMLGYMLISANNGDFCGASLNGVRNQC